jgi:hypothetical protein
VPLHGYQKHLAARQLPPVLLRRVSMLMILTYPLLVSQDALPAHPPDPVLCSCCLHSLPCPFPQAAVSWPWMSPTPPAASAWVSNHAVLMMLMMGAEGQLCEHTPPVSWTGVLWAVACCRLLHCFSHTVAPLPSLFVLAKMLVLCCVGSAEVCIMCCFHALPHPCLG